MKNTINTVTTSATSLAMIVTLLITTGCLGTSSSTTIDTPATGSSNKTAEGETGAVPPIETIEVAAPEPTAANVVTLGSGVKPGAVAPGKIVTVAVRVRIAEPWHIYAVNKPTGVSIPTKLELKLPEGVTAVGEWNIPDPKKYEDDVFVYVKDAVFRHQVKVSDTASGLLNIGCEVKYQPCNDESCKPPTKGTTSVALEVAAP